MEPEERPGRARDDALRAGIYCRLSVARFGDTTKVEDQERICRDMCAQRGWKVAEVYTDNSVSAWQKNRKRKGWDRMLADVESGKISAIVVYHGDRLIRQPFDLEKLILLAEARGVKLASPTGTRDFDNPDDRYIMRIEAAGQCRESDNTSRRKKQGFVRMRAEGLVRSGGRGGRAFGFRTDGVTHIPEEAAIVREAAARLLAGEPTGAIARDLTARGVRTPAGNDITHGTLRKMLGRPRYAGLMPDGKSRAAWEPVLGRDDWEAVAAALRMKAGAFTYATNARRYLLSGIARCGACGAGLQVRAAYHRPGQTGYGCVTPGCRKVYRSVALLDAYVTGRVIGRLAKRENPGGRAPQRPGLAGEWRALAAEREATEILIADHTKARHVHLLLARLDSLDARLAQLRDLAAGDADARLRGRHAGITLAEFLAEPLGTRRALVSACYQVTVLPASRRGPGFRTEDVRLVRRGQGPGGEQAEGDHGGEGEDTDDPQVTVSPSATADPRALP